MLNKCIYIIVIDSCFHLFSKIFYNLLLWLCITEGYILPFLISGSGLLQDNLCYCRIKLCNLKNTINTVQDFPDIQVSKCFLYSTWTLKNKCY